MSTDASQVASLKAIFLRALAITDPKHRQQYLATACGDDLDLQQRVEQLLAAHQSERSNGLDDAIARFCPAEMQPDDQISAGIQDSEFAVPDKIGPYTIREQIGEGGMGTVYVAQQVEPVRRKVALKIIRAGITTEEIVSRFEAERQALAMMDHPNIASILDVGTTSTGQPFFAMELVHGVPITEYADSHRMNTHERLEIFVKVCRAVQHAHRKGIIHRDLKPSNILVAEIDAAAVPKIIDFGLAKAIDQPLSEGTVYTKFTQLIGTPSYMSPEQAGMGVIDVDTRSDVYALGVLLHELLVGDTPFTRETFRSLGFDEVRRLIREVDPPRPSTAVSTMQAERRSTVTDKRRVDLRKLLDSLCGELDWLVMKSLEKDRTRRYQSAAELAEDVQRFLDNEPVQACPPSAAYQFKKFVQRNRLAVSATSFVLVALIAFTVTTTWHAVQVRRAWLATAARERRANDFLEGMRLQTAVTAFREQDMSRLATIVEEMAADRMEIGEGEADEPASMYQLLHASAHPTPVHSFANQSIVHDVAVSADRKWIVSIDEQGALKRWALGRVLSKGNVRVGESQVCEELGSHGEPAHAVAISPDGKRAVSGSTTGGVWFWDLEQGICQRKLQPVRTGVETLAWSPDGQFIAAGARYSEVWVCDADGNELFRIENDQRHESLLFSSDSNQLVVPTRQGIDVWDLSSWKRERSISTDPLTNVRAVCWAGSDRARLVAGERFAESLQVVDWRSGSHLSTIPVGAEYAKSLAASPHGRWLVAGFANGHLQMISLAKGSAKAVHGQMRFEFTAHQTLDSTSDETRTTVHWLDQHRFVSAGGDGQIHVWDRTQIRPAREIVPPRPLKTAYLLGEDELLFFFHGRDEHGDRPVRVHEHNPADSTLGDQIPFSTYGFTSRPAAGLLAMGGTDKVAIVSLQSGKIVSQFDSPLSSTARLSFSRDGSALAGSSDDQVCVWLSTDNWRTHQLLRTWDIPIRSHPLVTNSAETVIVDDERLGGVVELDVATGQQKLRHKVDSGQPACLAPQQDLLALITDYGIQVVDRTSNLVCFAVDDLSQPKMLEFFPDGRVLVSGHENGSVQVWHIPTGQALGTLYKSTHSVGSPCYLQTSEDARRLIIGHEDGLWRRPTILGRGGRSSQRSAPNR